MVAKAINFKSLGIDLELSTTLQKHELGMLCKGILGNGSAAMFRYVQFLDAVTYAEGQLVTEASTVVGTHKVTNDRDVSAVAGLAPRGVLFQAGTMPTQNQFGWIQVTGDAHVIGTFATGDFLIPHATNDGEAVVSGYTAAKANFNFMGDCIVWVSSASNTVRLRNLI